MTSKRPNDEARNKLASVIADALVESLDWDFVEYCITPVMEYFIECFEKRNVESFFVGTGSNGLVLSFEVVDEGHVLFGTGDLSLFEILDNQWPDCARSQADIIFALEHTVKLLKDSFEVRFGFPHEESAINADFKAKWPDSKAYYQKWTPEHP